MSDSNSAGRRRSPRQPDVVGGQSPVATLEALGRSVREAMFDVVWRQWGSIGGAVSVSRRAASLVDPEALILASLALEEPRLDDVLADWVVRNSDLLSVQRMRNLAPSYPSEVRGRLPAVARIALVEGKDHRWKPLTAEAQGASVEVPRRTNKRRAVRVRVTEPGSLMLRLRLAFGVGIKADVLALLLTADPGHWASVSMMARATGYTVAAVRKAIGDLAEARLIDSMIGTRTEYRAIRPRWQELLGMAALPSWRDWHERFRFVAGFLEWVKEAEGRPLTPYVLASRGRDLVEAHPAAFRWAGDDEEWSGRLLATEENVLVPAIQRLASWMEDNA